MDSILKSYYLTGLTGFSGFFSFLVSCFQPVGLTARLPACRDYSSERGKKLRKLKESCLSCQRVFYLKIESIP